MKSKIKSRDKSWNKIFQDYKILNHDFKSSYFLITAKQIKKSIQNFYKTTGKEVRILCMQTKREDMPQIMKDNNLFILSIKNSHNDTKYAIVKGEGYIDIPEITGQPIPYDSKLEFELTTSKVGDSEMQHIDYAFAVSIIRTFVNDDSLNITIRGRKYTPKFSFNVGDTRIDAQSVQTEVDAGYEGRNQIILLEAKNVKTKNTLIRQLYYPFRQWSSKENNPRNKKVRNVFFEKREKEYWLWEYEFTDINDYNSIQLVQSKKYVIL